MTNSFPEIEGTDVLLDIGSNTTEAHPVVGSAMKRAVKFHGTRLIVIDPRQTEIARVADIHLRPLPGTNVAYLNGMMNVVISEGLEDNQFVKDRTEGFEEL
jgi:predicted molibdopterin-dependent oxidoreductase YjgC